MSYAALAHKVAAAPAARRTLAPRAAPGDLRVGEVHDALEHEADRAADAVVAGSIVRHWSLMPAPAGLQRQPKPEDDDQKAAARLAGFKITAKDLLNPKVTGPLRSMSIPNLVDYKNKVADADVKRYVENLQTFSTPTQAGAAVDPLSGDMTMSIGNITVAVKPDVHGAANVTGGDTSWSFHVNPPAIPGYDTRDGKVINFPGFTPAVTVEITTSYEQGVAPEAASGYGRGTTPADVGNKATALRVHEGSHGEDVIEFLRNTPYPAFSGANDMKVADFEKAKRKYTDDVSAWSRALNKVKLKADCVGKTIDDYHKGEQGYQKICP